MMKILSGIVIALFMFVFAGPLQAVEKAEYAGQQHREIKAMSADEVSRYLEGKGMGMAKAAELNGYPGPKHVLDLAETLQLSDTQLQRTQQLFLGMQSEAQRLGRQLVALEKQLDEAFVTGSITAAELTSLVEDIEQVRAAIRVTHLAAHLEQKAVLSPAQLAQYSNERGYHSSAANTHQHGHH